jgi:hypothetical protein
VMASLARSLAEPLSVILRTCLSLFGYDATVLQYPGSAVPRPPPGPGYGRLGCCQRCLLAFVCLLQFTKWQTWLMAVAFIVTSLLWVFQINKVAS